MPYSEEEIKKYLNILQNYRDGLNIVSPVKDENIPPISKKMVSGIARSVFIQLFEFLSKI